MHSDQYLNLLMNEAGQQDPVVGDTVGLKTIILFFSFVVFFQQSLKRGKTEWEKKKSLDTVKSGSFQTYNIIKGKMEDAELNAIRQARLAELQKTSGGGSSSSSTALGQQQEQQQRAANDMTSAILGKVLETEARERLSRVRIVRPDRAQAVENYIMKLYSIGQIRQKLSEKDIVEILDGLSRDTQQKQQSKIVYNRKQTLDDDDEDDFFD